MSWSAGIQADLPVTDEVAAHTLSLPMFPGLDDEDQAIVIAAVRAAVERAHRRRRRAGPAPDGTVPIGGARLRVGLIGLGSMGRNHLRVLRAIPGVRLVAIADPDGAALDAAIAASGGPGVQRADDDAGRGRTRRGRHRVAHDQPPRR